MKRIYSLPDAGPVRIVNKVLLMGLQEHPDWFYDDFTIETAYGCPSTCIWNGGRFLETEDSHEDWQQKVLNFYASYGIKYRLIFTNCFLTKQHLKDGIGNAIASAVNKQGGYAMVSMGMMADYLSRRYCNLTINWSTTTDFGPNVESQIKNINRLSARNLVVLPYQFNNKPELLQCFLHPKELEVMVNERCVDNCPYRREHWNNVSKMGIGMEDRFIKCSYHQARISGQISSNMFHHIHRAQLAIYDSLGINHFKIVGRNSIKQVLEAYLDHFVRPLFKQAFVACYNGLVNEQPRF